MQKEPAKKRRRSAAKPKVDAALIAKIRAWQALRPEKRTNFLRERGDRELIIRDISPTD